MNAIRCPARFIRSIGTTAVLVSILLHPLRVAAQQVIDFYALFELSQPTGATASAALGIAERGWEPLTVVGTIERTNNQASCWIRVSNVWTVHELPGLAAGAESWANAVDHVPDVHGEWTLVVGAALDASGAQRPMRWEHVTNASWDPQPLPVLSGGHGEALGLLLPDATRSRAFICGWADELVPSADAGETTTADIYLKVPYMVKVSATGVDVVPLEFGEGLEGQVNDIASSGTGVFIAAGAGENTSGQVRPQLWKSMDDGRTWSNEEVPLPVGIGTGGVTDWDHEVGHWQGAGYGRLVSGATVPLVWELDGESGTWVIHELSLPPGDTSDMNSQVATMSIRWIHVRRILKQGLNPVVAIWVKDRGVWTLLEPEDYLLNPEFGTPVAPAGIDKYGRVAVQFIPFPPTGGSNAAAQSNTRAGILFPEPATGIDDGSVPQLIALTASPNPFQSGVRIAYTLPSDAFVSVTIHDVAGRVVARIDEAQAAARRERVVRWDGIARDGQRVASGVYFVRVETPYEVSTLKIVRVD